MVGLPANLWVVWLIAQRTKDSLAAEFRAAKVWPSLYVGDSLTFILLWRTTYCTFYSSHSHARMSRRLIIYKCKNPNIFFISLTCYLSWHHRDVGIPVSVGETTQRHLCPSPAPGTAMPSNHIYVKITPPIRVGKMKHANMYRFREGKLGWEIKPVY